MTKHETIYLNDVHAVAWDMDGTLLDSFGILRAVTKEVCEEMGRDVPGVEVFQRNFHGSLDDSLKAILGLDTDEELSQVLEHFLHFQGKHYEDLDGHLFDDALDLSERAAKLGIPQIVLTNRAHTNLGLASPRSIVARSILAGHVDEVRCGDDPSGRLKPDPAVVEDWLEKHGVKPEHLLVVGDQNVDARLALALGTRAILVQRTEEPILHLDQLPDGWSSQVQIVRSLQDVVITV
jgi:phosphoglycolate phosphatase-like HAD superfamily hydrolase